MHVPAVVWIAFHAVVVAMLVIDLGIVRRKARAVTTLEAVLWTIIWISLSVGFAGIILKLWGREPAEQFLAGYLVEYSLSVDNLFVFLVLFAYFRVLPEFQHRLLFWGILAEFAMRAPLLLVGTTLVRSSRWILYIFGAFLIWTSVKMALGTDSESDPEKGWVLRIARRALPVAREGRGIRFLIKEDERWKVTPMFLVLVVLNVTDLIFALDSIPAVLGVTKDGFIAYTSNVCALFGLRSLFFVVASQMNRFRFLKAAVSIILGFVGVKMLAAHWYELPNVVSLGIIVGTLLVAIGASVIWPTVIRRT